MLFCKRRFFGDQEPRSTIVNGEVVEAHHVVEPSHEADVDLPVPELIHQLCGVVDDRLKDDFGMALGDGVKQRLSCRQPERRICKSEE